MWPKLDSTLPTLPNILNPVFKCFDILTKFVRIGKRRILCGGLIVARKPP